MFDPVADKICIGLAAISLWMHRGLPVWLPAAIIGRDLAIVVGSVILFRRRDVVLPSNKLGRVTTVVLTATFFVYAIDWGAPQPYLIWACAILIAATFIVYLRNGLIMLRELNHG